MKEVIGIIFLLLLVIIGAIWYGWNEGVQWAEFEYSDVPDYGWVPWKGNKKCLVIEKGFGDHFYDNEDYYYIKAFVLYENGSIVQNRVYQTYPNEGEIVDYDNSTGRNIIIKKKIIILVLYPNNENDTKLFNQIEVGRSYCFEVIAHIYNGNIHYWVERDIGDYEAYTLESIVRVDKPEQTNWMPYIIIIVVPIGIIGLAWRISKYRRRKP